MAGAFMVASCLSQGARGPSHPSGTRAHRLLRAARHRSGFAEASAHRDGPDDGRDCRRSNGNGPDVTIGGLDSLREGPDAGHDGPGVGRDGADSM